MRIETVWQKTIIFIIVTTAAIMLATGMIVCTIEMVKFAVWGTQ